jgi:RimJ/RimL family protein N-acetyltransferase
MIAIRRFQEEDTDEVCAAIQESLAEVTPWLPDLNAELDHNGVLDWIQSGAHAWEAGSAYDFAIVDAETGAFLGGCGLTQFHHRHHFANLYYWVRSGQTRRGIARQAIRLAAQYGFENLGLQRVEIVIAVGNDASFRAAEKAGAKREGRLRSRLFQHGEVRDAILYSLIPADLEAKKLVRSRK